MIVFMLWGLTMLNYKRVFNVDDEICQFHLKQKQYYLLEGIVPTKDYLIDDMKIPEGFDEKNHYIYKVYFKDEMIALIDFQQGYRFSMRHDDECLWIGLFLVDESYQRMKFGKMVIEHLIEEYRKKCCLIQLACLKKNEKGMAFWKKLGFIKIDDSMYKDLEVEILEMKI